MIFFRFSKKFGFWVFLFHPTVVSVLLSASFERCFVSRMQDFFISKTKFHKKKCHHIFFLVTVITVSTVTAVTAVTIVIIVTSVTPIVFKYQMILL